MSVRVMGGVWELDLDPPQKYVLLAMADHADHEGRNVHPSIGLIAWKTGYSPRQVQRIVHDLTAAGLLAVQERGTGRGKPTHYRIVLGKGVKMAPFSEKGRQDVTLSTEKGDIRDTKRVTSATEKGDICDTFRAHASVEELTVNEPSLRTGVKDPPTPHEGSRSAAGRAGDPVAFESFWAQYPAGHGNKKKTAEAWATMRPAPAEVAAIMAGLAKWNACDRWRRGFVKDALVWLRDRWWQDEPPPPDPAVNGTPATAPTESAHAYFVRRGRGAS